MFSGGDGSGDALLPDTELLDLMEVEQDTAHFLHSRLDSESASPGPCGSATGTAERVGSAAAATATAAAPPQSPPPSFLVGGSLFARDSPARQSSQSASGALQSWRSLCGATGSVFCPFTSSFISVHSTHWAQLRAVGFRARLLLRGGCRVVLVSPHRLMTSARLLQQGFAKDDDKNVSGAAIAAAARRTRQAALFKRWGWGPALQQTLGAVLCAAPLNSAEAFAAALDTQMRKTGCCDGRTARLLRVAGSSAGSEWPLEAPGHPLDSGSIALHPPCRTRRRVLQAVTPLPAAASPGRASAAVPTRVVAAAQTCAVPAWVEGVADRPTIRLLGLPASVRAAFLDVPLPPHAQPAAVMDTSCAAALAGLAVQLREAVALGRLRVAPRLYYCPLAHAVDYAGVLDLRAFPILWEGGGDKDGNASTAALRRATAAVDDAPPVLSLGIEAVECDSATAPLSEPPLCVVVVGNAHLLSRRAVRRLLDQWTRNGAAIRHVYDRHHHHRSARTGSHRQWRTLLGSRLPLPTDATLTLSHLRTLSTPLGDVQPVFVGLAVQPSGTDATSVAVSPERAELVVCGTAHADLLHVEEPLSAALLRASAVYRTRLDAAQRREVVEAVTQSVVEAAPTAALFDKRSARRLRTGRIVFSTLSVPLTGVQGRLLLHEACEAALSLFSALDDHLHPIAGAEGDARGRHHRLGSGGGGDDEVVSLLLTYPLLSSLRIRHVLLSAFRAHASPTAVAGTAAAAAPFAPVTVSASRTAVPPGLGERVCLIASSLVAREREEAERGRLARLARLRAAATAVAGSSVVRAQSYAAYVEPPMLLGWWTATLLFRAPTLADVVPLRAVLLQSLRTSYAASHAPGSDGSGALRVMDVDILYFDDVNTATATTAAAGAAAGPPRRQYRRFGVRAALCPVRHTVPPPHAVQSGAEGETPTRYRVGCCCCCDSHVMARELAVLESRLQECLKSCARAALFFPLWTDHRGGAAATAAATAPIACLPASADHTSSAFLDFRGAVEALGPWTPPVVEQRLLSVAAAQRPVLSLTVGTRVVLLETVRVPSAGEADVGGGDPDCLVVWRGQVCEVVGFLAAELLLGHEETREAVRGAARTSSNSPQCAASVSSLPRLVQRQIAGWSHQERAFMERYVTQQRHASSLPLLRRHSAQQQRCSEGLSRHCLAEAFVATPRCAVVGGYRSLHYYALPLLHLPLLVLSGGGGAAAAAPSPQRRTPQARAAPLTATSPSISFDYVLSHLLHPHHTDPSSCRAAVCLTAQERQRAVATLFDHLRCAGAAAAAAEVRDGCDPQTDCDAARSLVPFAEDVFLTDSVGDPPVRGTVTGDVPAAPLRCPVLTALALFSHAT
ncbi:hypothetical protein NESM_000584700 [Novymonas esmeraldas]|uniref:Uncharacterized protein n=1 Tax=Novymonas esmeraldas TaxID=1808958 RepID=A0AAW0EQR3_9TRYP